MQALPIAVRAAADATARRTRSALPDAPTRTGDTRRSVRPVRRATAAALHRLADRLYTERATPLTAAHAGC